MMADSLGALERNNPAPSGDGAFYRLRGRRPRRRWTTAQKMRVTTSTAELAETAENLRRSVFMSRVKGVHHDSVVDVTCCTRNWPTALQWTPTRRRAPCKMPRWRQRRLHG